VRWQPLAQQRDEPIGEALQVFRPAAQHLDPPRGQPYRLEETSEDQALELAVIDAHAPHVAAQRHLLELELVQPHGRWAA